MGSIDLSRFALGGVSAGALHSAPHRPPVKGRFLRGPIPLDWLGRAATARGRALHVAIAIWFRVGLLKGTQWVTVPASVRDSLGIDRYAFRRGLRALEHAGLVQLLVREGRPTLIALLEFRSGKDLNRG